MDFKNLSLNLALNLKNFVIRQKKRFITIIVASLVGFAIVQNSCENDFLNQEAEQNNAVKVDESKLITFKGLKVNHRFSTPENDLEAEHSKEYLSKTYGNLKQKVAMKKGLHYKTTSEELPDAETIYEAAKNIIDQFPYGKIEEPEELKYEELDSLQIVEKEKEYELEQEKIAKENWEMIKKDFPTLTDEQIKDNIDIIDEYYEQNLGYLVLKEIADNKQEIAQKVATNGNNKNEYFRKYSKEKQCMLDAAKSYNWLKGQLALNSVNNKTSLIDRYAYNYYPNKTGEKNGGINTRGDAYRHMLFSAVLANSYFTLSAKHPRLTFANNVATALENCTDKPIIDSKAMDLHNNAIGRQIWYDNTPYRRFLGIPVGLRRPSNATLDREIRKAVNGKGCFIVKKTGNIFPNNELKENVEPSDIKAEIDKTSSSIPVYFEGDIVPTRYEYNSVFSHYVYYDCEDSSQNGGMRKYTDRCKRAVYGTERTKIIACYKILND